MQITFAITFTITDFHPLCVNISKLRTSKLAAAYMSNIFAQTLVGSFHV